MFKCFKPFVSLVLGMPSRPEDFAYGAPIYHDLTLNCEVSFPGGNVVPYVVQWLKRVYVSKLQFFEKQTFLQEYIILRVCEVPI